MRQVAAWRLGQGRISAPSEASRDVKFTPCILSNIARNYVNVAATCTTKMFLSEVHSYSIIFMVHFSHTQSIVDDNCKMLVSVCIRTSHSYSCRLLIVVDQCSAECGRGQRTRQAVCVDVNDVPLQDAKCQHLRQPRVVEVCDMGSCARTWFFTEWTAEVSN